MAKTKSRQNIPAIVITALAAILAIAAVIFLVVTISSKEEEDPQPDATEDLGFMPTDELVAEIEQAAYDLLPENYKVYQYLTRGMSVKEEPYGNLPEDGFYTCVNADLPTFEAFCDYVHSIYINSTAEKLITDPFGNGAIYGDDNGELGIVLGFEPSEDSGLSWSDVHFTCLPVSETLCSVTVALKDADGKEVEKTVNMQLEDGAWKLSDMIG